MNPRAKTRACKQAFRFTEGRHAAVAASADESFVDRSSTPSSEKRRLSKTPFGIQKGRQNRDEIEEHRGGKRESTECEWKTAKQAGREKKAFLLGNLISFFAEFRLVYAEINSARVSLYPT